MTTVPSELNTPVELDATPAEVKRYQRQKIALNLCSLVICVIFTVVLAIWVGPHLEPFLNSWVGDNGWFRLIAVAFLFGAGMEFLTLPLDFWSGFILEHRYQLSNQTFLSW